MICRYGIERGWKVCKRVKRMLLAYAIEYEDGSVGFQRIIDCDDIKENWEADLDWDRHTGEMYHASPGICTITGKGHVLDAWPGPNGFNVEDAPVLPAAPLLIARTP